MRTASFVLTILLALTVMSLDLYGTSSRTTIPHALSVVSSPQEAWEELSAYHVRGTTMVSISRGLYFVQPDMGIPASSAFPLTVFSLTEKAPSLSSEENLLWLAVETGVARRVIHVLPDDRYTEKLEILRSLDYAPDYETVVATEQEIYAPYYTAPRLLYSPQYLPEIDEPVILFVDASFFDETDTPRISEIVRERLSPALIIAATLDDDPAVTAQQRERLRLFLSEIERTDAE